MSFVSSGWKVDINKFHVEVANNGREAVEKYLDSPEAFDLIFMDIQMPEMDGMKATKAIRNSESSLKVELSMNEANPSDTLSTFSSEHSTQSGRIPIIAMTAHAMKGDRENCLEVGMDDYITKPIKREAVFEMIDKWVFSKA